MSPLAIQILLHWYACREPFHRYSEAYREAIEGFLRADLIVPYVDPEGQQGLYQTTARGDFYVKHLCAQPLPQPTFYIPEVS